MKIALVVTAFLLLTLSACGGTSDNATIEKERSESRETSLAEATTDAKTTPDSGLLNEPVQDESGENEMTRISITVGSSVFTATLYDNETAKAFAKKLPLTLNMTELNGNEKFFYLPERLPNASERVGSINSGDLMLYGSDCLVLFYEGFSTSHSYTRLGTVEDASGLASALGSGSVKVTFAVNDSE